MSSKKDELRLVQGGSGKPDYTQMLIEPPPELDTDPVVPRARLPRNTGLFAPVPLKWLTDRRWDVVFPERTRLYLYLLIKTRRGTRSAQITNAMAREIGIDRQRKALYLKEMEDLGFVSVMRNGKATPMVAVVVTDFRTGL